MYEFNDIEVFSATNAALADYRDRFAVVPDCNDPENYQLVKDGLSEMTKKRTAVDKMRLELTEPMRERIKAINDEGNRIISELKEIESPMRAAKKEIDEREKREKEERLAKLQAKVDSIRAFIDAADGQDSIIIQQIIEDVKSIDTANEFYDLTHEATKVQAETVEKLGSMLINRIEFEAGEKARIEAEQKAAELEKRAAELEKQLAEKEAAEKAQAEAEQEETLEDVGIIEHVKETIENDLIPRIEKPKENEDVSVLLRIVGDWIDELVFNLSVVDDGILKNNLKKAVDSGLVTSSRLGDMFEERLLLALYSDES